MIKQAATVSVRDLSPPAPESGVPIKPPVFPTPVPEKGPTPEEAPADLGLPDLPPSPVEGLEQPINDAVKDALSLLRDIVTEQLNEIEGTKEDVDYNTDSLERLQDTLTETIDKVEENTYQLDQSKHKRVPNRQKYESDQEYSDSLYNQIVTILDETISQVGSVFPDYQYLKSSITQFDLTGNILDGELRVGITLSNFHSKIRYHLEIPVYIFDGYIQHPEIYIYQGKTYSFSLEDLLELTEFVEEPYDVSSGAHWFDQNKNKANQQNQIPDKAKQKNYKKFDMRLNPVEPRPRFWNNSGIVEMNPSLSNIGSPPTPMYGDKEYSLY